MTTNNALKDGLILVSEASSQDSNRLNQTKDISQNLPDQKIRVLIVDDLRLVCEGLQAIFAEDHDIEIIGYALNGQDAINKISQVQPDVVVLDLVMPVMGGIETTQLISQHFPDVKILILTSSEEDSAVLETITAGADGYVLKSMIISDLSLAIRSVHSGSSHFAAGLINRVAKIATTNFDTQVVPKTNPQTSSQVVLQTHSQVVLPANSQTNNLPVKVPGKDSSSVALAEPQVIQAIKASQIKKAQKSKKPKQPIPEKPLFPYGDWVLVVSAVIVLSHINGMGHDLGHVGLFALALALIARPIKKWFDLPMKFRRGIGIIAFASALAHTIYATKYFLEGNWGAIAQMVPQHKWGLWLGIIAFLIMVPAAVTSFRFMQRKLGKNWRKIHLLTVPALLLAVAHVILVGPHYLVADGQIELSSYLHSGGLILIVVLVFILRQDFSWFQVKFSDLKQSTLKLIGNEKLV